MPLQEEAPKMPCYAVPVLFVTFAATLILALAKAGWAEKLPFALLVLVICIELRPQQRAFFLGWCRARWDRLEQFAANPSGHSIPWQEVVIGVALPFIALDMAHEKILGAIDTRPVVPTAFSLVSSHTWSLNRFRGGVEPRYMVIESPQGELLRCFEQVDDHIYSAYPLGMVPLTVPSCVVGLILGLDTHDRVVHLRIEKLTAALVGSICLSLFFLIGCCFGSVPAALLGTAFLGSGSALLTTVGLGLWQHGGVILGLLIALFVEFRSGGTSGKLLLEGFALGQTLACRPSAAPLVALMVVWAFWRSPRRGFALGVIVAISFLPWLILNFRLYHDVLGPIVIRSDTSTRLWRFPDLSTTLGVLISPARGLFIYQAWSLLAFGWLVPRLARCWSRSAESERSPRGWQAYCGWGVAMHTLLIAAWNCWWGGHCWGSRLLSEIVPLLGLLVIPMVQIIGRFPVGHGVLLALLLIGPLPHLPCLFLESDRWNQVSGQVADLWSWSNAPFLYRPQRNETGQARSPSVDPPSKTQSTSARLDRGL